MMVQIRRKVSKMREESTRATILPDLGHIEGLAFIEEGSEDGRCRRLESMSKLKLLVIHQADGCRRTACFCDLTKIKQR